jgi:N-acetylmuramoyl-L-alanine amidase
MKTLQWLQVSLAATATFFTIGAVSPTTAATFDNQEVNSNNFIAATVPFGSNQKQLLILEQISPRQSCWSESGSNPVSIDLLLLKFDFTGICARSTDSNGYSIRMNGQDLGLDYLLRVVERDSEMVLVGTHRIDRQAPEIIIGRTKGKSEGSEKIFLDPGWRFTRRTYQGKALGHIYLTNDSASVPVTQQSNPASPPLSTTPLPGRLTPPPLPTTPLPGRPTPPPLPGKPTPPALPTTPLPVSPPPERELIFTKPQANSTTPGGGTSATSSQTLPPRPESTVPGFVVPTLPQTGSSNSRGQSPTSNPQTLPSPPASERQIPVFAVPTK